MIVNIDMCFKQFGCDLAEAAKLATDRQQQKITTPPSRAWTTTTTTTTTTTGIIHNNNPNKLKPYHQQATLNNVTIKFNGDCSSAYETIADGSDSGKLSSSSSSSSSSDTNDEEVELGIQHAQQQRPALQWRRNNNTILQWGKKKKHSYFEFAPEFDFKACKEKYYILCAEYRELVFVVNTLFIIPCLCGNMIAGMTYLLAC